MISNLIQSINNRRPPGIFAGLTAAWAIFGLFLAIDSQLSVPPGTFYKILGTAFGISTAYAMYIGFVLFMITGVIISMFYNYISRQVEIFRISSMPKGIGTGILAGVIVWGVLFLPLNYYVMQPALSNIINTLSPENPDYALAEQLLELPNEIVFGSLALHVLFGGVMGFCSRLAVK